MNLDVLTYNRYGLRNVLIDCGSLANALSVHARLASVDVPGGIELIPAAQTVLIRFASQKYCREFLADPRTVLEHGTTSVEKTDDLAERTIEVLYDGEDLAEVAELTRLSIEAVIAKHTSLDYTVAFAGFAPGFFYLHAEDRSLDVARRATPRTRVPAGAVGLAGEFSGIYPRTSPGGWQLIGRTADPLWDIHQDPPALLAPGQTVHFKAVRELVELKPAAPDHKKQTKSALVVESPGAQLLYQDSGRRGLTHWGVSPSGYADREAAREANRLVGNHIAATVLESLMGGFSLTAQQDTVLAVTGAHLDLTISGGELTQPLLANLHQVFALRTGQKLTAGFADSGLRSYIAVRGGFATSTVANSCATDTLANLGPAPLAQGAELSIAGEVEAAVSTPSIPLPIPTVGETVTVRAIPGPRNDWFTEAGQASFFDTTWRVTTESNRIGVRLEALDENAPTIERKLTHELPSEGMISGSVQVPPSGEPVVFMTDHPVTGGYPVIATVHPEDLRIFAQSQPGTLIKFTQLFPDSGVPLA